MMAHPEIDALSVQRELLVGLDEITALQQNALDAGDLAALTRLSEMRTRVVREAAPFVPPTMDWTPNVADLAVRVRDRSDELQRSIQACMTSVRKELIALTERQRATQYLVRQGAVRGATWRA